MLWANWPIRISNPFVSLTQASLYSAPFLLELEHETSNGAISASAKYFFIIPGVLCLFF
jgi:hypothetical protein